MKFKSHPKRKIVKKGIFGHGHFFEMDKSLERDATAQERALRESQRASPLEKQHFAIQSPVEVSAGFLGRG